LIFLQTEFLGALVPSALMPAFVSTTCLFYSLLFEVRARPLAFFQLFAEFPRVRGIGICALDPVVSVIVTSAPCFEDNRV